jgi:hypothetical protein
MRYAARVREKRVGHKQRCFSELAGTNVLGNNQPVEPAAIATTKDFLSPDSLAH